MITDEALRDLLAQAAAGWPEPAGAQQRIVAAASVRSEPGPASSPRWRLPRPRARVLAIAAVVGVLAGFGGLVGLRDRGAGASSGAGGSVAAASGVARSSTAPEHHAVVAGPSAPVPAAAAGLPQDASTAGAPTAAGGAPAVGSDVIETGSVSLQVPARSVQATLGALERLASADRGFVAQSQSQLVGAAPSATVTLRIPSPVFGSAVAAVAQQGTVVSEQQSGQDVTGQVVDLAARISALETSRTTYLEIEAKAVSIGSVLAVQQQIDAVEQQLEQLQGQQRVLADQTSYGSLTVSITGPGAPPRPVKGQSGLGRAVDKGARAFVHGVEDIVAALGPLLLIVLVAAVLAAGARFGWRLNRRRLL
jgi:hypothetical protein